MRSADPIRAFTLFEMLIAAVLLVCGIVPVLGAFTTVMRADADLENKTVALALAQQEIERIKGSASWDDIDDYAVERSSFGGDHKGFERMIVIQGDPKEIDIVIFWEFKGNERSLTVSTLMANYGF